MKINIKQLSTSLIIIALAASLFAGCSSTKASTNTNRQSSMKATYSSVLSALVTDKTITQSQSDKVLDALTAKPSGTKPENSSSNSSKKQNNSNSTGTRPKNNRLSGLVTSGVITQTQADTINQKIMDAMKSNRSEQNNQNN